MEKNKTLDMWAYIVAGAGALHVGVLHFMEKNYIESLLTSFPQVTAWVYGAIGLGGVYVLWDRLAK